MNTGSFIRSPLMLAGLGLALILASCDKAPTEFVRDNPIDPGGDDFIPPVTSLGSVPIDTLESTSFEFSWTGSSELLEFAYRLDDNPYSAWTEDTTAMLEYLDEGDHLFEVKSRYPTGVAEDIPVQSTFVVDAVPPGSILIYPYRSEVIDGDTITVEIRADGIEGLTVLDCKLEYDTTAIIPILGSVVAGSFLTKDGGTTVLFKELEPNLNISVGVAQGPEDGVHGSGILITCQFEVLASSSSSLVMTAVDARGPNDQELDVTSVRGSVIVEGE